MQSTEEIYLTRTGRNRRVSAIPALARPVTRESIVDLANIAAENTVDGFIAQDRLEFDRAVLHWSQVFHALYPEFDSERVMKAAEAFITALFAQSKLKDDNQDPYIRVHDEKWEFVRSELVRMCSLLDLPASFGVETCNFYRYHSIKDDHYVKHIIEWHRVLMNRQVGADSLYRELAGLYLSALSFHDKHNRNGVIRGREIMKLYYTILFEAKYGVLADA